jgi:hypothetical protein
VSVPGAVCVDRSSAVPAPDNGWCQDKHESSHLQKGLLTCCIVREIVADTHGERPPNRGCVKYVDRQFRTSARTFRLRSVPARRCHTCLNPAVANGSAAPPAHYLQPHARTQRPVVRCGRSRCGPPKQYFPRTKAERGSCSAGCLGGGPSAARPGGGFADGSGFSPVCQRPSTKHPTPPR